MPSQSPSEPPSSTEHQLRRELIAQSRFLDGLVQSLEQVSAGFDGAAVFERTAAEARRLFGADAAIVLSPAAGERSLRPAAAAGLLLGPLADVAVALDAHRSPLALAARDMVSLTADAASGRS